MGDGEGKAPAIFLYVKDYLSASDLMACSDAAQGVWFRMLCYLQMTEAKTIPGDLPALSNLLGRSCDYLAGIVSELEANGVFSRTDTGRIYNRRLAKASNISFARAKAGKKGGLKKAANLRASVSKRSKPHSKNVAEASSPIPSPIPDPDPYTEDNTIPPCIPPKGEARKRKKAITFDDVVFPTQFDDAIGREATRNWLEFKAARNESYETMGGITAFFNKAIKAGCDSSGLASAVESSMASNYAGIFPEKHGRNGAASNGKMGISERNEQFFKNHDEKRKNERLQNANTFEADFKPLAEPTGDGGLGGGLALEPPRLPGGTGHGRS